MLQTAEEIAARMKTDQKDVLNAYTEMKLKRLEENA